MNKEQVQEIVNKLSSQEYRMTPTEAWMREICVKCKKEAKTFKDQLSEDEYHISGYCQGCQDQVFD